MCAIYAVSQTIWPLTANRLTMSTSSSSSSVFLWRLQTACGYITATFWTGAEYHKVEIPFQERRKIALNTTSSQLLHNNSVTLNGIVWVLQQPRILECYSISFILDTGRGYDPPFPTTHNVHNLPFPVKYLSAIPASSFFIFLTTLSLSGTGRAHIWVKAGYTPGWAFVGSEPSSWVPQHALTVTGIERQVVVVEGMLSNKGQLSGDKKTA